MNKLRALFVALGSVAVVSVAGVYLGQRDFHAPADGVTNAELVDAGILNCPVRNVRWRAIKPNGRVVAQEGKVRVCPGQELAVSREVKAAVEAGWQILWVRDLGAATNGEADPTDAPDECACSSGASCTATAPDGGTGRALPPWTVAGPDYQWKSPSGAGCVAIPCTETSAGLEWPEGCLRQ